MGNLPGGCTELDIDRLIPDHEPEYEPEDNLLIDAAIEEARMRRWAA